MRPGRGSAASAARRSTWSGIPSSRARSGPCETEPPGPNARPSPWRTRRLRLGYQRKGATMPRRRKVTRSQSLGGKLEGFRREVERVMESLRREIARRESELSELKGEYGRVMSAFGHGARASEPAAAPRAR